MRKKYENHAQAIENAITSIENQISVEKKAIELNSYIKEHNHFKLKPALVKQLLTRPSPQTMIALQYSIEYQHEFETDNDLKEKNGDFLAYMDKNYTSYIFKPLQRTFNKVLDDALKNDVAIDISFDNIIKIINKFKQLPVDSSWTFHKDEYFIGMQIIALGYKILEQSESVSDTDFQFLLTFKNELEKKKDNIKDFPSNREILRIHERTGGYPNFDKLLSIYNIKIVEPSKHKISDVHPQVVDSNLPFPDKLQSFIDNIENELKDTRLELFCNDLYEQLEKQDSKASYQDFESFMKLALQKIEQCPMIGNSLFSLGSKLIAIGQKLAFDEINSLDADNRIEYLLAQKNMLQERASDVHLRKDIDETSQNMYKDFTNLEGKVNEIKKNSMLTATSLSIFNNFDPKVLFGDVDDKKQEKATNPTPK